MKYILTLLVALLPLIGGAQSTKLLEIDGNSLAPIQTDALSGVAIDKIGTDPSKRPCARIKLHINRMTKEEIRGISVRPIGGSIVITKCIVATEGNGLIIELTAKEQTRLILHHDKYGDSNEVSLNLEGNKEYRLDASLNTTHSIVVSSNVINADVYIDNAYKGAINQAYTLTIPDIYPGRHRIKLVHGSLSKENIIEVNSSNVYFRIELNQEFARPQYVFFQVTPKDANLIIDNKSYVLNSYGEIDEALMLNNGSHTYSVSAKLYHEEKGTFVVSGAKVEKIVNLKPAFGYLRVPGDGTLTGASVYIDDQYIGEAPLTSGKLASGTHTVRVVKPLYKEATSQIIIKDGATYDHKPLLVADFATVTLSSKSGSDIYINGQLKGKSPWTGDLRSGAYSFEARMANHRSSSITKTISSIPSRQSYSLPEPTPILGHIDMQSSPSAEIYIDDKLVGRTPLSMEIITGKHTISFRKDGFATETKIVEVVESQSTNVKVTLQQASYSSLNNQNSSLNQNVSLSSEPANCYIVSQAGTYSFPTVKGNSSISVGNVYSANVLWESFGTATTPQAGDLIRSVSYKDGKITFNTNYFREGNAVIAAKDVYGKILWSWHIWFTDKPQEQTYYNNAGTMMDRNLGATSATPGEVGALGLHYQWGRKDPFLCSSSISSSVVAKSTITWPLSVESDYSTGTIEYATTHPTTFINKNSYNNDWYYTGKSSTDKIRWTESSTTKSIYDPCPTGWRVPDGNIWEKAIGSETKPLYNESNKGYNFSSKFGSSSTIWYPAAGRHYDSSGTLGSTATQGAYWTASNTTLEKYHNEAKYMSLWHDNKIYMGVCSERATAASVRCVREKNPVNLSNLGNTGYASSEQKKITGSIKDITIEHNVYKDGVKGMKILVDFTVQNMKGISGSCAVYFYYKDGTSIKDTNGKYDTTNGNVATHVNIKPSYDNSTYTDLEIFMPNNEIEVVGSGKHELKFYCIIWENSGSKANEVAESDWYNFTLTK